MNLNTPAKNSVNRATKSSKRSLLLIFTFLFFALLMTGAVLFAYNGNLNFFTKLVNKNNESSQNNNPFSKVVEEQKEVFPELKPQDDGYTTSFGDYLDKSGEVIDVDENIITIMIEGKRVKFPTPVEGDPSTYAPEATGHISVQSDYVMNDGSVVKSLRFLSESDVGKTATVKRDYMFFDNKQYSIFYVDLE